MLSVIISAQAQFLMSVKIVTLPDDIKVEENIFKETLVRNLSDVEIYEAFNLYVIDGAIYIANSKTPEIVKLSMQGLLLGRAGNKGQGPGEFVDIERIYEFEGNIAVLDSSLRVILYTKNLKYNREMKLKKRHQGFLVDRENNFVFFGFGPKDFYFEKYSKDLTPIESFGPSVSPGGYKKNKLFFEEVRLALYVPEDNGIWASFKNRYDIRYYKNQELAVEITAEKGFFKTKEENFAGRIVVWCKEARALCLAKSGSRLFYFYRNNGRIFCDIYDSKSYRLLHRVALKHYHYRISHYKENIFYSMLNDESEENLLLFKLEF